MLRNRQTFFWIFAGLAAAVLAGWAFNLSYYREGQLDKPLFLQHYIEAENNVGLTFHLYALQNRESKNGITEVQIPGFEQAETHISQR